MIQRRRFAVANSQRRAFPARRSRPMLERRQQGFLRQIFRQRTSRSIAKGW